MNNARNAGAPSIAIITPTGSSDGRTIVRAITSEQSKIPEPQKKESGISRKCERAPPIRNAWGMIKPKNPITPAMETLIDVMIATITKIIFLVLTTSTPEFSASISEVASKSSGFHKAVPMIVQIKIIMTAMIDSSNEGDESEPNSQVTFEFQDEGSLRAMIKVQIEEKNNPEIIPTNKISELFLKLFLSHKKRPSSAAKENKNENNEVLNRDEEKIRVESIAPKAAAEATPKEKGSAMGFESDA